MERIMQYFRNDRITGRICKITISVLGKDVWTVRDRTYLNNKQDKEKGMVLINSNSQRVFTSLLLFFW